MCGFVLCVCVCVCLCGLVVIVATLCEEGGYGHLTLSQFMLLAEGISTVVFIKRKEKDSPKA